MIQVQLGPETEVRILAQTRAKGLEAEAFIKGLNESAVEPSPLRTALDHLVISAHSSSTSQQFRKKFPNYLTSISTGKFLSGP
jgi:hypothetical protein